jgi:hypothetical protein
VERKKLKIGLLLDDYTVPAWIYQMIHSIQNSDYAEVTLIVRNLANFDEGWLKKLRRQYRHVFYKCYRILENLVFKPDPDAFELKDLRPFLSCNIPVIEVMPIQKRFSDFISDADIKKIGDYSVDVFLRLGFRILKGKILNSASYGIWSFHHGDNLVNRGGPAGAWEVINGWELTGSVLQILKDDLDGGTVLYRSWSSTYKYSINYNLNYYYWKSLSFIPRCLERLYRTGHEAFFKDVKSANQHPFFYSNQLFLKPKNSEFFKFLLTCFARAIGYAFERLFKKEQWILYYSINERRQFSNTLYKYKKMVPPKGSFWADPFVVANCSKYYVFFEEYLDKARKGHISCIEMDKSGNYSGSKIILDKPYHLSYPFVFQSNGKYYMIPESRENKTIELYESTCFPDKWEFVMNLMENIDAVDATIHVKDNKFWLFANICEYEGSSVSDELFLFYANEFPSNKWTPHPQNPVISDVRSARPAGKLFEYNGNLYRPSQDGSRSYGFATNINHILELNEASYKEVKVSSIQPNWDKKVRCTHSFSFDGNLTVVDALIKKSRF